MNGTPPITFKWFRSGQETPLHAITVDKNTSDFQIQHLSQGHSDSYHCQALNYANLILSPPLHIQGETARQNRGSTRRRRYSAATVGAVRAPPSGAPRRSGCSWLILADPG